MAGKKLNIVDKVEVFSGGETGFSNHEKTVTPMRHKQAGGRPRKPNRQPANISFYIEAPEKEKLLALAESMGITISAYIKIVLKKEGAI